MFDEFNEVLNLANNDIEFVNNIKKVTEKSKEKKLDSDYAQIGSSRNSAQIGSSGDYAQIGSSGDYAQIGSSGYSAQIGSSGDYAKIGISGDYAKIGSSGDYAQIGSSGDYTKIGSSGDYAQIGSSSYSAQIGISGNSAKIGSSGNYAKIGSSGDYAQIGSSGYSAQIGISGDSAKIGSSGDSAKIGSSGDYTKIGSSGDYAKIGSSGYSAQIGISGDYAKIGSSGYSAKIGSSGDYTKIGSSGDYAKIECKGNNSIISAIGLYSTVSAKIGNWITLAEFKKENDSIIVDFVKTEFVDNDKIKENIRYCLYNHTFKEVVCFDEIDAIVLSKKKNVYKVITFDDYFTKKESFIVTNGENYSHGETIKQAKADLIYKISNRDTSQFNNLTLNSVLPKEEAIKMYRIITGACEFGTKQFVSSLKKTKKEYSVKEIIDLTIGQFGNEKLKQFFEGK